MFTRNVGLAFAALFTLFAASSANANTVMCHSCTDPQMNAMAFDHLGRIRMYGPHYFVDLDRGVIRKYIYRDNMTPEFDPEYDAFEAWVELAPVEPQLVTAVTGATQELVMMKGEARNVLTIPSRPDLPSDGYESVMNTAMENALRNYITNNNKYYIMFASWFEPFDIPFFNESYMSYPQPIEYASGDTAVYRYNKDSMKWERVPNTLKDAAGNSIPETAVAVGGGGYQEYDFPDTGDPQVLESMNNLIHYAGVSGYNVVDKTNGETRGGFYVVTCTETTCSIWYIQ